MNRPNTTPTQRPQRDMTPATADQVTAIRDKLDEYKPVVRRLLAASSISEDTFVAWIANACRASRNGDLWRCEPETVLGAALRCAQLELAPNDGNNLAWIIPRAGKAQFQLGYGGVLELARRAVPGIMFTGKEVYPGDSFSYVEGRTPVIRHTPHYARRPPKDQGGDAYAWYVIARFPDGREQTHMLGKAGVEYHRAFSKTTSDDSMWNTAYNAAALKSVILDMRRWLPQTRQMAQAVAADGATIDIRQMHTEAPELPTPPEQLGAGTVDDDTIADGEPEPPDPDDQWVAQARQEPLQP